MTRCVIWNVPIDGCIWQYSVLCCSLGLHLLRWGECVDTFFFLSNSRWRIIIRLEDQELGAVWFFTEGRRVQCYCWANGCIDCNVDLQYVDNTLRITGWYYGIVLRTQEIPALTLAPATIFTRSSCSGFSEEKLTRLSVSVSREVGYSMFLKNVVSSYEFTRRYNAEEPHRQDCVGASIGDLLLGAILRNQYYKLDPMRCW
jgi:hypothetical protein